MAAVHDSENALIYHIRDIIFLLMHREIPSVQDEVSCPLR